MMRKSSGIAALAALACVTAGITIPKAMAAPAQPAAFAQEPWDVPPGEFNEVQRRGFHDGVEGARRDFGNHRNPDVDNREEFRHPDDVPGNLHDAYRAAFRRGYEIAASHLWNMAPPPVPQPQPNYPVARGDWGTRGLQSDAERHGYHEGQEAANRDYQSQRRPDPDDHEQFRNPPVPPPLVGEFREGFMRGYEVAISQLSGEPAWQMSGDPTQWAPPPRFSEMQRRGFHDGVDGAHRDFGNHRRPDVANREEYRSPRLPEQFWPEYRQGFRRGYEMAASRLWGGM